MYLVCSALEGHAPYRENPVARMSFNATEEQP